MDYRVLAKTVGGLLIILGCIIITPGIYALAAGTMHASVFFSSGAVALLIGGAFWLSNRSYSGEIGHRMGFAVVTLSWVAACILGAFPYFLSGTLPSFADALFESTSGFSGTGASVLTDIEAVDRSLLLWRSMTQWLGGMGIIVFFIAILPILGIGGVQLFRAETTGPQKDKITPRVRDTARNLWRLYIGFTLLLSVILVLCGMTTYDAINHAMTTLSTGGFSTKNIGVAAFDSAAIDYAIAIFMLIGSISFSLHFRLIAFRDKRTLFDTELKVYLAIIAASVALLSFLTWGLNYASGLEAIRASFFTVLATISSTGFTNANYLLWPELSHFILILLMIMGGMSGSTAGGMKCIRLVAAFKLLLKELKQVVHPHAMLTLKSNEKSIRENVASAIWGFLFLYLFVFSVISALLVFQGLDMISASTATFSALSNIGPAFGTLGPLDNYAALPVFSKMILCIGMIMGRLEFFTVIVILTPAYWRK